MEMNRVMDLKVATDDILTADLASNKKGTQLPALEEWEMVLVGGGEFVPCW